MKLASHIVAVFLGLLSLAAGIAKIALVPGEAEFLSQFGFSDTLIMGFGFVQCLGGVLIGIPVTRFYGSLLVAAGFALSALLIAVSGDFIFAGVSCIPVAMAAFVSYQSVKTPVKATVKDEV